MKLALFRKEQAETRQVDLLLVGLDLREVDVDGEVRDEVLGDAVFDVEPDVAGRRAGEPARARSSATHLTDGVWLDLEVETGVRHLETDQRPRP